MSKHRGDTAYLISACRGLYNSLYPVGDHQDAQWDSAVDYLEWTATILLNFFGTPPVNDDGFYTERITP